MNMFKLINVRSTKFIVYSLIFISVYTVGSIGYGFYLMEIEDHYGDMQELFHIARDGDVVVNVATYEFGTIEKAWTRAYVADPCDEQVDLYRWAYHSWAGSKLKLYRPRNELNISGMDYEGLVELIADRKMRLVLPR